MEQIEWKTANLRHFPNLSFAFVNLPGIFHLFFINFSKKQKFNNRDKNHFVFEQKGGLKL
jgi:hypothetical protein